MATSVAWKPQGVANYASTTHTPFEFSRRKMDATEILRIAENLTGTRQNAAMNKVVFAATHGQVKEPGKFKTELIKIVQNGAAPGMKYDSLLLLSEMDVQTAFRELYRCIKKGGIVGDCAFIVLENLATKSDALREPIIHFLNHMIENGETLATRESAEMSKERIDDLCKPKWAFPAKERPLAEPAMV